VRWQGCIIQKNNGRLFMKVRAFLASVVFAAFAGASQVALAAPGYVSSSVNLRAGPDGNYPVVARLRRGSVVEIQGCIRGWRWCEVQAGPYYGWVSGAYVQAAYRKRRVRIVESGPVLRVPIISFNVESYWDEHYRDRSFYRDRDRWRGRGDWRDRHDRHNDHDHDRHDGRRH
jgi:uncharacterized protein YraI